MSESFEEALLKIDELFHQFHAKCKKDIMEKQKYNDITITQYRYLVTISKLKQPTYSDIADALMITKASVTGSINKLIERGFLYSKQSKSDSRKHFLYLSPKGKKITKIEELVHKKFSDAIKKSIDKSELKIMTQIFDKIIEKLTTNQK